MLVYCVQGRSAKTERSKGKVFQGICFTDLFHLSDQKLLSKDVSLMKSNPIFE